VAIPQVCRERPAAIGLLIHGDVVGTLDLCSSACSLSRQRRGLRSSGRADRVSLDALPRRHTTRGLNDDGKAFPEPQ
jgi:hypothetical protein